MGVVIGISKIPALVPVLSMCYFSSYHSGYETGNVNFSWTSILEKFKKSGRLKEQIISQLSDVIPTDDLQNNLSKGQPTIFHVESSSCSS